MEDTWGDDVRIPLMTAPCPLCHTVSRDILADTLRRGTGKVYRCQPCDLGFLVAEKHAPDYYARDYRQQASHKADGAATNPEEIFEVYSRYQEQRLQLVTRHLPILNKYPAILEIGASAGQFLRHFNGYGYRLCAIELDPACCEYMKRMDIETDDHELRMSKFAGEKFDVVVAFQVIEHVDDPVSFMRDIRSVLRPGGVAIIECPNLRDGLMQIWDIEEYRKFYYHADHLWYFGNRGLEKIAEQAGFASVDVKFTQDYGFCNHLHWLMNRTPQADCHVGLGRPIFRSKNPTMTGWLAAKLAEMNAEYIDKLVAAGATSNITLIAKG